MIEEMKQLTELISKLPGTAMWIMFGFAVYKLVTYLSVTGSVVLILKLLINKVHDAITKEKVIKRQWDLDGQIIIQNGTKDKFLALVNEIKNTRPGSISNYVHSSDVDWLREAVKEKKLKEEKESKK